MPVGQIGSMLGISKALFDGFLLLPRKLFFLAYRAPECLNTPQNDTVDIKVNLDFDVFDATDWTKQSTRFRD